MIDMLRKINRVLMVAALAAAPVVTAGMASAQTATPVQTSTSTIVKDDHGWWRHHCRDMHEWWQPRCQHHDRDHHWDHRR
ncbi:hypothetical protein GPX89_33960 [Nocardia sp. ET3-3]|uniref:Uncharacterized protein n=1 Tax=Nocardia terrae TaxID=2675851 RepID=A0A7K1V6Y2_9NOCA|nr:hypothetical protein [Nocardia terrae]MVU82229.1 hypothetical protein [Nocardia terrae]